VTITVFHDVNGNGRFDNDETWLPGWTVDVQGPGGQPLITNANGRAHLDNLADGAAYSLVLLVPPDSNWFTTTPNPQTWIGSCSGALFGVNQLMLPVTGANLTTDTGGEYEPFAGVAPVMRAGRAALGESASSGANFTLPLTNSGETIGRLSLSGVTLAVKPTRVKGSELLVPDRAAGISWSALGGLRLNWHAGQFPTLTPIVGDAVSLMVGGVERRYRVTQALIVPAGSEGIALDTVPPDHLLLVTCRGVEWSHRLLIWAAPM
jgi:hypothetical protein